MSSPLLPLSRRTLFRLGAVTVTGATLEPLTHKLVAAATDSKVTPRASAECVVMFNLVGSPSQMDTFDLKESKSTPEDLDVRTTSIGTKWPFGLLPETGKLLDKLVIVRSMAAWETLHNLAQYYMQVGHQFTAARSAEMPSMGSIVALESLKRRRESDFLPPFVSMNFPTGSVNGGLIREGFLDSSTSPLAFDIGKGAPPPFLVPSAEMSRFDRRLELLSELDQDRKKAAAPRRYHEWDSFTRAAHQMIKSPKISGIFEMAEDDRKRYGSSALGDAAIIARNMIAADAGARYILLNHGGWDHHAEIYGKKDGSKMEAAGDRGGIYQRCREFDRSFASLLMDLTTLKAADGKTPLIERTFLAAMGEFGRTPGDLNDAKGRDHWPGVRSALFAGGGIRHTGRIIGATDEQAAKIVNFDWHKKRPIYPEDVTATMYSVLGIDWTKRLSGTPSGREFIYVEPMSGTTFLGSTEIRELFE
jgi:hypothetical protein